jgi:NADPH-dependent curcumin reductase CurA
MLRSRETHFEGLQAAPAALLALLRGQSFGRCLVDIGPLRKI